MPRLPLLLFILAAAGVINPSVRAQADPYARPYVEKALSPVYGWSARYRVKEIARGLEEMNARGQPAPPMAGFSAHLRSFYRDETAHLDPWGNPIYMQWEQRGLRVVSAGPDGLGGTGDDIFSAPVAFAAR